MAIPPFLANLRKKVGHDLLLVPTVVVIARDDQGRLLLVHDHDSDQWTIPGGIMEPGERPADAAVREVFEETQIQVLPIRIIGVIGGDACETHYSNGDKIAWVATIFEAHVVSGTPFHDGTETKDARFVSPEELENLNLRNDTVRFLKAEMQSSSKTYYDLPTETPNELFNRS